MPAHCSILLEAAGALKEVGHLLQSAEQKHVDQSSPWAMHWQALLPAMPRQGTHIKCCLQTLATHARESQPSPTYLQPGAVVLAAHRHAVRQGGAAALSAHVRRVRGGRDAQPPGPASGGQAQVSSDWLHSWLAAQLGGFDARGQSAVRARHARAPSSSHGTLSCAMLLLPRPPCPPAHSSAFCILAAQSCAVSRLITSLQRRDHVLLTSSSMPGRVCWATM